MRQAEDEEIFIRRSWTSMQDDCEIFYTSVVGSTIAKIPVST